MPVISANLAIKANNRNTQQWIPLVVTSTVKVLTGVKKNGKQIVRDFYLFLTCGRWLFLLLYVQTYFGWNTTLGVKMCDLN